MSLNSRSSRTRVKCTRCTWTNVRNRDNACEAGCPLCTADVELVRDGDVPPRGMSKSERKAAS